MSSMVNSRLLAVFVGSLLQQKKINYVFIILLFFFKKHINTFILIHF